MVLTTMTETLDSFLPDVIFFRDSLRRKTVQARRRRLCPHIDPVARLPRQYFPYLLALHVFRNLYRRGSRMYAYSYTSYKSSMNR